MVLTEGVWEHCLESPDLICEKFGTPLAKLAGSGACKLDLGLLEVVFARFHMFSHRFIMIWAEKSPKSQVVDLHDDSLPDCLPWHPLGTCLGGVLDARDHLATCLGPHL